MVVALSKGQSACLTRPLPQILGSAYRSNLLGPYFVFCATERRTALEAASSYILGSWMDTNRLQTQFAAECGALLISAG